MAARVNPISGIPLTERKLQIETVAPTTDERDLVSRLLELYESAREHKLKWSGPWELAFKMYLGDQWESRPDWKASPVHNFVFSKSENLLSFMTNNRPRAQVLPNDPLYQQYADIRQKSFDYKWSRLNMDRKVYSSSKNALLYSKGVYKVGFDPDEKEIFTETVDPQNFFADPHATSTWDARFVVEVSTMPYATLELMYPGAVGKVEPGTMTVDDPDPRKDHEVGQMNPIMEAVHQLTSSGSLGPIVPATLSGTTFAEWEDVQVLDWWLKDPTMVADFLKDEMGVVLDEFGKPIPIIKPKYPGGRHIVMCGGRIIHDEPNPDIHGRFPYVDQDCHPMPGEFWGTSPIHHILILQREYNKCSGQFIDSKNLEGMPQTLVPTICGVKVDMTTGEPGLQVEYNPGPNGEKPERIAGVPAHPVFLDFLATIKQDIDAITGVSDVTEGRKPSGIQAGVAIEQLQESASVRLSGLVRPLEDAIRRIGELWLALEQQYYTEPRMIRVTDPVTGAFSFIEMTPEMINGQWDIEIVAGSTLPRSREARQNLALSLYQVQPPIVDRDWVLDYIEAPGKEAVKMRMRQMDMIQAQIATEQAAAEAEAAGASNDGPPEN